MCTTAIALGLTALQGYTQYRAADAQADAQMAYYNAQADAAEQNARIQERRGEQIADQYLQQQQKLDARRKLVRGQQAAAAGASGLAASGSVLDVMGSSEDAYRKDSLNLLSNQRNDTWSNYVNVVNYQNQANAFRASAANAEQQGKANKFNTILGTATSMFGIARDGGWFNKSSDGSNGGFVYQSPYQTNRFSPSPSNIGVVSNNLTKRFKPYTPSDALGGYSLTRR